MKPWWAIVGIGFLVGACSVIYSLQPPTPEWTKWCEEKDGTIKQVYGQIWACEFNGKS